jgi:hypothetical protein
MRNIIQYEQEEEYEADYYQPQPKQVYQKKEIIADSTKKNMSPMKPKKGYSE